MRISSSDGTGVFCFDPVSMTKSMNSMQLSDICIVKPWKPSSPGRELSGESDIFVMSSFKKLSFRCREEFGLTPSIGRTLWIPSFLPTSRFTSLFFPVVLCSVKIHCGIRSPQGYWIARVERSEAEEYLEPCREFDLFPS